MVTRRRFLNRTASALTLGTLTGAAHSAETVSGTKTKALPAIQLGKLTVSRLILGGNPFSGNSHSSGKLSREMRDYYTAETIKECLEDAYRNGVNAFLGRADKHIMRLLHEYWNEGGSLKIWIAQTAPENGSMKKNIDQAIGYGAAAIYIQGNQVDAAFKENHLSELVEWLEMIKKSGAVAGMASHRTDNLPIAEEKDFPVDFYMQCFYNMNVNGEKFIHEDRAAAAASIKKLDKPVIGYKILAAGRNDPDESFSYAFSHIRQTDAVCVGVFPKHRPQEIAQNAELTRKYSSLSIGGS